MRVNELKRSTFLAVVLLCVIEVTNIVADTSLTPKGYRAWRSSQSEHGIQ